MIEGWEIRRARPADFEPLVALWERSVRATHDFLTEADIVSLRPLVGEALRDDGLDLWVLVEPGDVPIGFMGSPGRRSPRSSSSPQSEAMVAGANLSDTPRHSGTGS